MFPGAASFFLYSQSSLCLLPTARPRETQHLVSTLLEDQNSGERCDRRTEISSRELEWTKRRKVDDCRLKVGCEREKTEGEPSWFPVWHIHFSRSARVGAWNENPRNLKEEPLPDQLWYHYSATCLLLQHCTVFGDAKTHRVASVPNNAVKGKRGAEPCSWSCNWRSTYYVQ